MFYCERQKSKQSAKQSVFETPTAGQELNLDTLSAFLRKRYRDRESTKSTGVSDLVGELMQSGYTTLDKLHLALDASMEAFNHYEKEHPPRKSKKFTDVGVVRLSMAMFDPKFSEIIYSDDDNVNKFRKDLKTS